MGRERHKSHHIGISAVELGCFLQEVKARVGLKVTIRDYKMYVIPYQDQVHQHRHKVLPEDVPLLL